MFQHTHRRFAQVLRSRAAGACVAMCWRNVDAQQPRAVINNGKSRAHRA